MPSEPQPTFLRENELDLPAVEHSEELETEVLRAKAELEELRRKQEQIEKEKLRLEELRRRQDSLEEGKEEMLEKLSHSLDVIAKEYEELQQRQEQLRVIQRNFTDHLHTLENLHPRSWTVSEASRELAKGQGFLEEARSDFNRAQARLAIEAPHSSTTAEMLEYEEETTTKDFTYWLKSGFAFTLPLQILGLAGILVWVFQILASR